MNLKFVAAFYSYEILKMDENLLINIDFIDGTSAFVTFIDPNLF
jgi:hypothetical protein